MFLVSKTPLLCTAGVSEISVSVESTPPLIFVDYTNNYCKNPTMNPVGGFSIMNSTRCGLTTSTVLLLLCSSLLLVSGNSLSKSQSLEHNHNQKYNHHHRGCDTIHRVLNETTRGHFLEQELHAEGGFLTNHDQWHNHKDCKYLMKIMHLIMIFTAFVILSTTIEDKVECC